MSIPSRQGLTPLALCSRVLPLLFVVGVSDAQKLRGPVRGVLPHFEFGPELRGNPNGTTPLSAEVEFTTDLPTRVSLHVDDGFRQFIITDAQSSYAKQHEVPVLGLHANRTNEITVLVTTRDGLQQASEPVVFVTPPLPIEFPPITVTTADTSKMEPGVTLIEPLSRPAQPVGPDNYGIVLDPNGEVVWYSLSMRGVTWTRRGTRLISGPSRLAEAMEVDMLGNVIGHWYATGALGASNAPSGAIQLPTVNAIHHEFAESPEGADSDFVFLSADMRAYPNYPDDQSDLSVTIPSANVVGDVVVEMLRDGTIVREKNFHDIIDPYRIGYEGLTAQFWNSHFGTSTRDWTHANSVIIDTSDDTYIVSLRHQDAIVKIRRDTPGTGSPSDVVWILGNHDYWNAPWDSKLLTPITYPPAGGFEFEWQYHQHAARLKGNGDLICFDNGNYRAMPPDPYELDQLLWYSRAVEYRIDPSLMTVMQIWAAGGLYDTDFQRLGTSHFVSNSQELPITGNVLSCSGGSRDATTTRTFSRFIETTHTDPPVNVFDVTIKDPTETHDWISYRSNRLPSLYPPGPPTDHQLQLFLGPLENGQPITVTVTGADKGDRVFIAIADGMTSERMVDSGPCLSPGECFKLLPPWYVIGAKKVDQSRVATFATLPIPPGSVGLYSFQAAVLKGATNSLVSNTITAFFEG